MKALKLHSEGLENHLKSIEENYWRSIRRLQKQSHISETERQSKAGQLKEFFEKKKKNARYKLF